MEGKGVMHTAGDLPALRTWPHEVEIVQFSEKLRLDVRSITYFSKRNYVVIEGKQVVIEVCLNPKLLTAT
jgi:hypothetical protein